MNPKAYWTIEYHQIILNLLKSLLNLVFVLSICSLAYVNDVLCFWFTCLCQPNTIHFAGQTVLFWRQAIGAKYVHKVKLCNFRFVIECHSTHDNIVHCFFHVCAHGIFHSGRGGVSQMSCWKSFGISSHANTEFINLSMYVWVDDSKVWGQTFHTCYTHYRFCLFQVEISRSRSLNNLIQVFTH